MKQEPHKRLIIHEELMPACRHFPPLRALLFVWDVSSALVCSVSLRLSLAIMFSEPQKLGLVATILALRRLKQEDLSLRPAWASY